MNHSNKKIIAGWTFLFVILLLILIVTGSVIAQSGGRFQITQFHTGSGGELHGGSYTMRSTVGQPEAGVLRGGDYELGGGYWGGGEPQYFIYQLFLPAVTNKR